MADDLLTRDLRTALVGVLSDQLTDPDRLAVAVYSADVHARQIAAEVARTPEPAQ